MKEKYIAGTEGYAAVTQPFVEATLAINFGELHRDFLPFIPQVPSRVLDVGAGIGRDAYVLSTLGHSVMAVEPTEEFRKAGHELYPDSMVAWLDDSLPDLKQLENQLGQFNFILASGVWHHLDPAEQARSLHRIARLLRPDGIFALTLRHGPAGRGTHVFPTNGNQTIEQAEKLGLKTVLFLANQPSLMKNKEQVFWTKLVFQK